MSKKNLEFYVLDKALKEDYKYKYAHFPLELTHGENAIIKKDSIAYKISHMLSHTLLRNLILNLRPIPINIQDIIKHSAAESIAYLKNVLNDKYQYLPERSVEKLRFFVQSLVKDFFDLRHNALSNSLYLLFKLTDELDTIYMELFNQLNIRRYTTTWLRDIFKSKSYFSNSIDKLVLNYEQLLKLYTKLPMLDNNLSALVIDSVTKDTYNIYSYEFLNLLKILQYDEGLRKRVIFTVYLYKYGGVDSMEETVITSQAVRFFMDVFIDIVKKHSQKFDANTVNKTKLLEILYKEFLNLKFLRHQMPEYKKVKELHLINPITEMRLQSDNNAIPHDKINIVLDNLVSLLFLGLFFFLFIKNLIHELVDYATFNNQNEIIEYGTTILESNSSIKWFESKLSFMETPIFVRKIQAPFFQFLFMDLSTKHVRGFTISALKAANVSDSTSVCFGSKTPGVTTTYVMRKNNELSAFYTDNNLMRIFASYFTNVIKMTVSIFYMLTSVDPTSFLNGINDLLIDTHTPIIEEIFKPAYINAFKKMFEND